MLALVVAYHFGCSAHLAENLARLVVRFAVVVVVAASAFAVAVVVAAAVAVEGEFDADAVALDGNWSSTVQAY